MSENFIRHFISLIGTVILLLAWLSGYFSSPHGWWWTGFGAIVGYFIIYSLLEV